MVQFRMFLAFVAENGPKIVKNCRKWQKMGMNKWPISEKNISSDLPEIGPKYHFRTNNYDYKGFGMYMDQNFSGWQN